MSIIYIHKVWGNLCDLYFVYDIKKIDFSYWDCISDVQTTTIQAIEYAIDCARDVLQDLP